MKKYKLIKKYPSLPNDWEVGMIVGTGDRNGYTASYSPCSVKYTDKHINYNEVVNNPEFWQEVIEYPVGTKVKDTKTTYEYVKTNVGWATKDFLPYFNESEIGEGKRFQVVEEPKWYKLIKQTSYNAWLENDKTPMKIGRIVCSTDLFNNKPMSYWIEGQEKYWEEIEEPKKDYEILSFYSGYEGNSMAYIFKKDLTGQFTKGTGYFNENHGLQYHKIHSVKRLSDGEVFTVGDNTINGLIKSFEISEDPQHFGTFLVHTNISLRLSDIQKAKSILFTTEDGVGIRDEHQLVFSVSECDYEIQNHQDYAWVSTRDKNRKYHHFSTREAAKEYILMNKPCLSFKEVWNCLITNDANIINDFSIRLKQLVKSKL